MADSFSVCESVIMLRADLPPTRSSKVSDSRRQLLTQRSRQKSIIFYIIFQLQKKLSNFNRFFPTSLGSFQLRLALSIFSETFQHKTFQFLVLPNCPFQLHVSPLRTTNRDQYVNSVDTEQFTFSSE